MDGSRLSGVKYQVGNFDETFEAGVALDVELVELNAVAPGLAWFQQVLDLVTIHIDGKHAVIRLPHQLVAQVRPNEPSGSDHADLERLDWLPIQVQPRRRHCNPTTNYESKHTISSARS